MILDQDSLVVIVRSKVAKELEETVASDIEDTEVKALVDIAEVTMVKAARKTAGHDWRVITAERRGILIVTDGLKVAVLMVMVTKMVNLKEIMISQA